MAHGSQCHQMLKIWTTFPWVPTRSGGNRNSTSWTTGSVICKLLVEVCATLEYCALMLLEPRGRVYCRHGNEPSRAEILDIRPIVSKIPNRLIDLFEQSISPMPPIVDEIVSNYYSFLSFNDLWRLKLSIGRLLATRRIGISIAIGNWWKSARDLIVSWKPWARASPQRELGLLNHKSWCSTSFSTS